MNKLDEIILLLPEDKRKIKDLMLELIDGLNHHDTNTDELRKKVEEL